MEVRSKALIAAEALMSVQSNCFGSLVRALTTISRVTLLTFWVRTRKRHALECQL